MAIFTKCDICHSDLKGDLRLQNHFCERCQSFAQEYMQGSQKVISEGLTFTNKQLNKYRVTFLRDRVLAKKLKAV